MNGFFKEKPEERYEESDECRAIAYCDHCGFAIYAADEALRVKGSRDVIHTDCWEEYAAEHMCDFTEKADAAVRFGYEL